MINFDLMNRNIRSVERFRNGPVDPAEIIPEVVNELQQMREELSPLIDTLPEENMRIILTLFYMEGFTAEEIAEAGEMSDRNVFYYLKRGKTWLKETYPDRITLS